MEKKNKNLNVLVPLFLVVCYWVYLNMFLGYFLSKIFIETDYISKNIQFEKKFTFKNIIKISINFFWRLIKNWFIRIQDKIDALIDAIEKMIEGLKSVREQFKSILKFKHNFRLLEGLRPLFMKTFMTSCSLINEICFFSNIIRWIIQWLNFIKLLMENSFFFTRIVYFLYLLFLSIFGILIGFLLGFYKHENEINEIYIFLLLLLLQILYSNGFNEVLLNTLSRQFLEHSNIQEFSKFSLKNIEQVDPLPRKIRPPKIMLEGRKKIKIPVPFLITEDPRVDIEIEVLLEDPINYKFQLFQFYQDINEKIKH